MVESAVIDMIYDEVQRYIKEIIKKGLKISTQELQDLVYRNRDGYKPDSRQQKDAIYGCLLRGRENAIRTWDNYIEKNGEFDRELKRIQYYEPEAIKKELSSDDFNEFYWNMQHGRFGKDTAIIEQSLGDCPAIAVVFNRKMLECSEETNNFVASSGGKNALWYMPSWWKWNIREYKLYLRTLAVLRTQLKRGISTKVLMPSGIPLDITLPKETLVRAMLENNTAWNCSKCGARNIESSKACANCDTAKS